MTTQSTQPRVKPLSEPYSPEVAETLRRMMPPGVEPLKLFRTVAHNPAILERFRTTGAYILNYGTIDPLDREVIIPGSGHMSPWESREIVSGLIAETAATYLG